MFGIFGNKQPSVKLVRLSPPAEQDLAFPTEFGKKMAKIYGSEPSQNNDLSQNSFPTELGRIVNMIAKDKSDRSE